MLPDVSKRRKLFGYNLKDYDSKKLKEILELKNNDGITTPNCVRIVRGINEFLDESKYLIVQASAIFYFLKDLDEGKLDGSHSEVIRVYAENIDPGLLDTSLHNVMKIMQSLAAQRRFFRAVKDVIKVNRINKDWENLLDKQLEALNNRIMRLREISIPANLDYTPMGAYSAYLAMSGVTVYDDIRTFVENSWAVYEDTDAIIGPYKDHVVEILCSVDDCIVEDLLKKAREGVAIRNRRLELIKQSVEQSKAAELDKAAEDAREIVFGLCSNAGRTFRRERANSLMTRARKCSSVWVVAAGRAKPFKTGYLNYISTSGRASITTVMSARIFDTEESARKAAEVFRSQNDFQFAEVAEVDLYSYNFDPYH